MPLVGIWVNEQGNLAGDEGWKPVFDKQGAAMNAPITIQNGAGETFEQVLQSIGPIQIVSKLKHSTTLTPNLG